MRKRRQGELFAAAGIGVLFGAIVPGFFFLLVIGALLLIFGIFLLSC